MNKKYLFMFFIFCFSISFLFSVPVSATEQLESTSNLKTSIISSSQVPFSSSIENPKITVNKLNLVQESLNSNDFFNEILSNQVCMEDGESLQRTIDIEPYKTCSGSGGTARIEYQSGADQIWWSVNPNFSFYYYFNGEIEITTSTGSYISSWDITGSNFAGITISNAFNPNLPPGAYSAEITGWCFDTNGTISKIIPNCKVAFYVI